MDDQESLALSYINQKNRGSVVLNQNLTKSDSRKKNLSKK